VPRDAGEAPRSSSRTLGFGTVAIGLIFDEDGAAEAEWLAEFLEPWFTPTSVPAEWRVKLSIDEGTFAQTAAGTVAAAPRACFTLDQEAVSYPSWRSGDRVLLADEERACFLRVAPGEVEIVAHPGTRKWRLTLMRVVREIAITRLRQSELELHAAAVETSFGAMLICGPKGSGKTTLSVYLMRHAGCGFVANDRVFVGATAGDIAVRGVPSAISVRANTLERFPELLGDRPDVARPCLQSLRELATSSGATEHGELVDLILSPAQLVDRLKVAPVGRAPLRAIVLPAIEAGTEGFRVERLDRRQAAVGIWANLYGRARGAGAATIFEEFCGGRIPPSQALADLVAERVPVYRLSLGPAAYATRDGAERLTRALLAS
jgi:hypothetical protein